MPKKIITPANFQRQDAKPPPETYEQLMSRVNPRIAEFIDELNQNSEIDFNDVETIDATINFELASFFDAIEKREVRFKTEELIHGVLFLCALVAGRKHGGILLPEFYGKVEVKNG